MNSCSPISKSEEPVAQCLADYRKTIYKSEVMIYNDRSMLTDAQLRA